jgi:hypothetical protein
MSETESEIESENENESELAPSLDAGGLAGSGS